MKKLFGGINLTWKKLIPLSIFMGIYTAIMAIIPLLRNLSFGAILVVFITTLRILNPLIYKLKYYQTVVNINLMIHTKLFS